MPVTNRIFPLPPGQLGPQALQLQGPWIEILIAIPSALETWLKSNGKPVPAPVPAKAMIDTGATLSAADDSIFRTLGVSPIGIVQTGTAGGPTQQYLYPARFVIKDLNFTVEFSRTTGVNLSGSTFNALIGRDVLSIMNMFYNGPLGVVTLSI